jgi:hypothetical protein
MSPLRFPNQVLTGSQFHKSCTAIFPFLNSHIVTAPSPPSVQTLSNNTSRRCIIFDEDPQRVIDSVESPDFRNKDPADLGAVGDVIGEEDDDAEEVDNEVHDEQDSDTRNVPDVAERKFRHRRPLPTWLADAFKLWVAEANETLRC